MSDRIRKAFADVHAPGELVKATRESLRGQSGRSRHRKGRAVLRAAAVCAAAAVCFVLGVMYGHEAAYVSLDINPSMSISVNRFGRVIGTNAYNTASEEILRSVQVGNKNYAAAVSDLLDAREMQPYLDANSDLWIAVQAEDREFARTITEAVDAAALQVVETHHPGVRVQMETVTEEVRTRAEAAGLSAARYLALSELQAAAPETELSDFAGASIQEIHDAAEAHHGETPAAEPSSPETSAQETNSPPVPAVPAPAPGTPPAVCAESETTDVSGHHGAQHHGGHD